jgi:peptide chain release factor 3
MIIEAGGKSARAGKIPLRPACRMNQHACRPCRLIRRGAPDPPSPSGIPVSYASETRRRRTFAIISHPDAGKTTLTEKLLLFSGAIQIAGSVKARKASRHATSDWMEIEKQRGISVASSVMQMLYREHVINLLDTPGHKDFSEDTYRVLTAVDSALMVIDAANGVEAQTRRLIEVCRQRDTPIITFVNKMDREVRDPLDILDEVERELGMPCVPMTWPVGQGKTFGGIINLRTQAMTVFESGSERRPQDFETVPLTDPASLQARFGHDWETAMESMELATGASPAFDREAFLAGKQTPVFFGSGVNNFGVMEVLDALVDLAPSPGPRKSSLVVNKQPVEKTVLPDDEGFSGVVFKVQANMDANHRDRIAFVRVASGKYTPGMKLKVQRSAKELRPTSVVTFMSQRREAVEEAYAGDIIGFTTHGGVQLGDTITDGASLQFTGLPFFAPELFMTVILKNPLRTKQLQTGLEQLGEEGAIQVFKPESRRPHAAGRGGPAAVRGGAAPPEERIRLRRAPGRLPVHRRALDHRRHARRAARVHQRLPATPGAGRRQHPGLPVHQPL